MPKKNIEEILSGKIIDLTDGENCTHILVKVAKDNSLVVDYNGYNPLFNKEMIGKDIICTKDAKLYVGEHNQYIEIN